MIKRKHSLVDLSSLSQIRKLLINVNQAKNEVIEAERTEKPSQFKLPSVWSKIVNFFSVDPPTNDVNGAELNYKTRQHLECVENNLQTIFQVRILFFLCVFSLVCSLNFCIRSIFFSIPFDVSGRGIQHFNIVYNK